MDCNQTEAKFCEVSADACDEQTARAVREHLANCPPCEKKWREFENSMLACSTATQPVPTSAQTRAMWEACEKKCFTSAQVATPQRQSAPISVSQRIGNWFGAQPRWSLATLGAATAIFCGVWISSVMPASQVISQNGTREYSRLVSRSIIDEVPLGTSDARAQMPPRDAAFFIDHHASMGFDPFTDHVGPTLVSFSASAPARSR